MENAPNPFLFFVAGRRKPPTPTDKIAFNIVGDGVLDVPPSCTLLVYRCQISVVLFPFGTAVAVKA